MIAKAYVKEEMFSSNKFRDLKRFYKGLDNVQDLIYFSKERPMAISQIYELNKEYYKNIIVVVPTKDISKSEKDILRNFPDTFIIVVESGGQYFNFAKSMNLGISKALSYNPSWVILSNDDLKITEGTNFIDCVNHTKNADILLPTVIEGDIPQPKFFDLYEQSKALEFLIKISSLFLVSQFFEFTRGQTGYSRTKIFKDKGSLHYVQIPSHMKDCNLLHKFVISFGRLLLSRRLIKIPKIQPISAVKAEILKNNKFDEVFINNGEDTDLAIRLSLQHCSVSICNIIFSTMGSVSLKKDKISSYRRNIQEFSYLGYKLKNHYLTILQNQASM